ETTAFVSNGVSFNNFSDGDWAFWEGFAYSNMSDTTTPGLDNQYSAYTGSGYNIGDDIYAVGFVGFSTIPTVTFTSETSIVGGYFTNTTYAALAMRDGDAFAKKFGGASGDDPDWFILTITGKDASGSVTGSVDLELADYTFADNAEDYIVNSWEYVDLNPLGVVKSLEMTLASSDTSGGYMNTPGYFAMDNLVVPEPCTLGLLGIGALALRKRRRRR
ncbi:MAG: DUF4465 domain-containing protein, partial [Planctomycetota bacterium]